MFVITTLSVIGLPMLNSFVGEFLVLSGSMQAASAAPYFVDRRRHHRRHLQCAAYMLVMIQRVFYGDLGRVAASPRYGTLNAREHLALWPMVVLFLAHGRRLALSGSAPSTPSASISPA